MKAKKTLWTIGIFIAAAALLVAAIILIQEAYYMKRVKPIGKIAVTTSVTAHAGAMDTQPNTYDSIRTGMELIGGGSIEVDVRYDAGGVPVLSHDRVRDGEAQALPLEDLFSLAAIHSARMNLDLKEHDRSLAPVLELAEKYGLRERIFFTGLEWPQIHLARELDVPFYVNISPCRLWEKYSAAAIRRMVARAKAEGALGLNMNYRHATATLVQMAHEAGLEVSVWTVDKEKAQRRMLALGVDNITTRKPDVALALLEV
ncbi:MAG: glycerophosphodiester phosphodiesterase [Oscillospiraceae bacterium]|nr:glycerophosphodiester phosphodiesterase [Oscillospiraceae bacterium]